MSKDDRVYLSGSCLCGHGESCASCERPGGEDCGNCGHPHLTGSTCAAHGCDCPLFRAADEGDEWREAGHRAEYMELLQRAEAAERMVESLEEGIALLELFEERRLAK